MDLSGRRGLGDKFYGDINNFGFTGDKSQGQPQYRVNIKDANQDKDGQMVSGIFNPLRKYGYLSPAVGTIYSVSSGTTDSLLISATRYDSINDIVYYLTGITGTANHPPLLRTDGIDSTTLQTDRTMPSGTVGGSLEIYLLNGVRTLFYSYNTASAWRIGTKILDGGSAGTFNDNFLGSGGSVTNAFEPTSNGEMKFVNSGDGFLYVLNANHLHRVDGTTIGGSAGTVYKDVLLAPDSSRFTHGCDFNGNLYLAIQKDAGGSFSFEGHNGTVKEGANFTRDVGIYIWNRQASFTAGTSFIPIKGVREIRALWVSPKNDIRCITISANGVTQIRIYDGTQFKVVKELGACAYPNYTDSLTVVGGFTTWLGYDGNLYYHGSEGVDINITNFGAIQNEKEFLFIMGSVGGSGIQDVLGGAIFYGSSNGVATGGTEKTHPEAFTLSYTATGTSKLGRFFPFANNSLSGSPVTTTTISDNPTPIFTPIKMLPALSTLKHLTIMMARETGLTPGNTDAIVSIFINGSASALMAKLVTTDDIMKGYKAIEINTPFVDSVQLSIQYSGIAMSNKRFNPSYAVIDFVPTETIK